MKVKVRLTQRDFLEHTTTVITETAGLLEGNRLIYFEGTYKHIVEFSDDCIIIERRADVTSITTLLMGKTGTAEIRSAYGVMELDTKLCAVNQRKHRWIVNYEIISRGETVSHLEMIWEITDFS